MADYKTITINPGDSAYIPKNAVILAKSETGNSQAVSDCVDLNIVGQFTCMEIGWEWFSDPSPGSEPWNALNYPFNSITGIRVGDNLQVFNTPLTLSSSLSGFVNYISSGPFSGLFQDIGLFIDDIVTQGDRSRWVSFLYFKVPTAISDSIYLELQTGDTNFPGYTNKYSAKAVSSTRCPAPELS